MARTVYVLRDGELVDKSIAPPRYGDGRSGPAVISDTMDPIRSMADGRMYDSKSQYRAGLKARGCIEVGNERVERRPVALPPVRDTLRQAYQQFRR